MKTKSKKSREITVFIMRNEIYLFVYFLNGERVSYDYAYSEVGDTPTRLAC